MIQTTYNLGAGSVPVLLITEQPDWNNPVAADFDKQTRRTTGLSVRENREEMADKLIATLKWKSLLNMAESDACRVAISAWANQPVLCPFWPAETLVKDYAKASVQGLLRVWYEPDWRFWEINEGTKPTTWAPTANARTCPLMCGRFDEFPSLTPISGNDDEYVDFGVVENGPAIYALEPLAVALTTDVSVNSQPVYIMTVPFAWGGNSQTTEVRITREQVGFGRASADVFYAQTPRTHSTLSFESLNTAEVAYIFKLFRTVGGSLRPWWCKSPYSLSTKVYGRFYGDKLSIEWTRPYRGGAELAKISIEFLSLPTEESVPGGETFATTIGPIPARWWGYAVVCGGQSWYFTSYESNIVGPGSVTYFSQKIEHGQIEEEINLVLNDCELTLDAWFGCPFAMLVQQLTADPMMVTIYEGLVSNPGAAVAIYTGQAMAPRTSGARMTIKLRGPASVLSIQGPRIILQENCAACVYDERCTMNLNNFKTTQTLNSITNGIGDFNVTSGTVPGNGAAQNFMVAGFFKGGYAERTYGLHVQRYAIADSYTDPSSPFHLKVLFAVPVTPGAAGEAGWVLVAGCDGYFSTCKNRFNNKINHRGHPYMPRTNPGMIPLQTHSGASGKKS